LLSFGAETWVRSEMDGRKYSAHLKARDYLLRCSIYRMKVEIGINGDSALQEEATREMKQSNKVRTQP
jgi:biotin carboxylase